MVMNNRIRCICCGKAMKGEYCLEVGDIIYCPDCSAGVEVIGVNPLKLRETENDAKPCEVNEAT